MTYGKAAFVGRFRNEPGLTCERGQRVVVQSSRGTEIGTVLCGSATGHDAGRLVRPTDDLDECREIECREHVVTCLPAIEEACAAAALLVDVELLQPDAPLLVSVLADPEADLDPLGELLQERLQRVVLIQNLGSPKSVEGCGKPGCGSTDGGGGCGSGGGCSTGSCSKGSVKSADELTNYFAGLRQQMEATSARIPL